MAKILTDREMGRIVHEATHRGDVIDCADAYEHFLEDLGELVCTHFGGTRGRVGRPDGGLGWTCAFHINECVPDDGGIFKEYDRDVVWENGREKEGRAMKMEIGKTLYVNVERLALVDGFERNAPYCQLTGDRQVVIDAECFEVSFREGLFNGSPELRKAAGEIVREIEAKKPADINIYC